MVYKTLSRIFLGIAQVAITFGLMAVGFLSSASAQTQRLAVVVDQYEAWRGGQAFENLTSIDEAGTFADGGLSGPSRLISTVDGRLREDLHFGSLSTAVVADRVYGSYTNFSGQLTPLSAAEVKFAHADAKLLFASPFLHAANLALAPDEVFKGAKVNVIDLHDANGPIYAFLITPSTGILQGIRIMRNGATGFLTLTDWRVVTGVRIPFQVQKDGDIGFNPIDDDTTDFTVNSASLNAPLSHADFVAPAPRVAAAFRDEQKSSGWIPFLLSDNLIFLPITVNGHQVQAIFDSGASTIVLDRHYAASIGVEAVGDFRVLGQGGAAAGAVAPSVTMSVGDMKLTRVAATLLDLGLPGTQASPPLEVILGAEAFNQAIVDIDYPHRRLRFLASGTFHPLANSSILPLMPYDGGFNVPVSVVGRPPVQVLLDTGNDGTFQIFPAYWKPNNLLAGRASSVGRGGGVGGLIDYDEASFMTLGIGAITLHDVGTAFELPGDLGVNHTVFVGNLGDEIISRFHVIIDVPDEKIAFMPTKATGAPFAHDLVGLETMPTRQALKVIFVQPNSPAAATGIKVGEEIVAIDKDPVRGDVTPSGWDTTGAGKMLTLKLDNGATVTMVKRRYD